MEESSAAIAISCSLVKPTIVISIEKFIEMLSSGFVVDVEFLFRRLKVLTIATSLSSPLLALMFSLFPGNCKSLEVFDCSLSRLNQCTAGRVFQYRVGSGRVVDKIPGSGSGLGQVGV